MKDPVQTQKPIPPDQRVPLEPRPPVAPQAPKDPAKPTLPERDPVSMGAGVLRTPPKPKPFDPSNPTGEIDDVRPGRSSRLEPLPSAAKPELDDHGNPTGKVMLEDLPTTHAPGMRLKWNGNEVTVLKHLDGGRCLIRDWNGQETTVARTELIG